MGKVISGLEGIIESLGGWPGHFGELEKKHGEGMLALQLRRKSIDEAVFFMVQRYAAHRAEYDRLSAKISTGQSRKKSGDYLTGHEQQRAYHKKELLTLERELLVTPASKVRANLALQTDFLDLLKASEPTHAADKVVPWKPLGRGRAG